MSAAIAKAIKICGSQEALATRLKLTQRAVSYLLRISRLPRWHCIPLERATKGGVPRWVSRPDLWQKNGKARK
jgi:DNA-binding transcriptional regulator YdaS (Cro superfamily)